MIDWYLKVMRDNYANFSGRARRSEYWYFVLCQIIIFIPLLAVSVVFEDEDFGFIPFGLYAVVSIIPYFAVLVRRLHDSGKSGWYYFVRIIPLVGPIWLLVLLCTDGDNGTNQYGNDPKNFYDDINEIGKSQDY